MPLMKTSTGEGQPGRIVSLPGTLHMDSADWYPERAMWYPQM